MIFYKSDKINNIEWVVALLKMQLYLTSRMLTSTEYFTLTQLLQVSNIEHQLNVNKKYEHLSKIRTDLTVG